MGSWLSTRFFRRNGYLPAYLELRPLLRTLRWRNRVIPALFGLVLLTSAALKAHELATSPNADSGLLTPRWSLISLIELELGLGLCLLLALFPRQVRLAALVCFTTFDVVIRGTGQKHVRVRVRLLCATVVQGLFVGLVRAWTSPLRAIEEDKP